MTNVAARKQLPATTVRRVCRKAVAAWLLAWCIAGWAAEESKPKLRSGDFLVVVDEGGVTLHAKDASLAAVIRSLGEKAGIQVIEALPADERVTVDVESQTLESSIKLLAPRYVAVFNESGQVRQLYLLPKGADPDRSATGVPAQESEQEPFKFSFDPLKAPRAGE